MLKLALTLALGLALTAGLAWAETDLYDDHDVISKDARSQPSAEAEDVHITASGSHAALFADGLEGLSLDSSFLGSYFGRGDEFTFGESRTTSREESHLFSHVADTPVYEGHGGEYGAENVYGPLWGVPSEAVGLEGYNPWEYFLLMGVDPEQVEAQAHGEHQHTMTDGEPAADAHKPAKSKPDQPAAEPHGISCDNDD